MGRKIVIIGALLLLGILLVVSCSPKESSITPTPSSTPTPPGTELPPSAYLPEVPRISAEEVKAKLDAGYNIVIVDSRSKVSYDQSHIAGAISIPIPIMAGYPYSNLDGYDELITYCNCPDEEDSARAVKLFMEAGYSNAKTIEGGIGVWKKAGFPVE